MFFSLHAIPPLPGKALKWVSDPFFRISVELDVSVQKVQSTAPLDIGPKCFLFPFKKTALVTPYFLVAIDP